MQGKKYFELVKICEWDQLVTFYEKRIEDRGQWVFRGQSKSEWGLKTNFERAIERFEVDLEKGYALENQLIRKFKRQCHHYIKNIPKDTDTLEWLALMQHYGAPTRLLDWSYSFWAALYFALKDAAGESALWALNTDEMIKPFRSVLRNYPDALECWERDEDITESKTFKQVFLRETPIALVGAVNPYRLNERLIIQQGIFLCPGDTSKSFQKNLDVLLDRDEFEGKLFKLTIDKNVALRKKIILHLHRMNMNEATLFPGLDGFARSLETELAFREIPGVD